MPEKHRSARISSLCLKLIYLNLNIGLPTVQCSNFDKYQILVQGNQEIERAYLALPVREMHLMWCYSVGSRYPSAIHIAR